MTNLPHDVAEDDELQFLAVIRDGTDSGRRHDLDDVLAEVGIDPRQDDYDPPHGPAS